ncbi:MAG: serine hydrolase [Leptolyngbyaceae cyanobacterium MO_188.B28]|nr:serine hydrolase [Leptolyngbyaceae cyanobacterium MO_188.B28]
MPRFRYSIALLLNTLGLTLGLAAIRPSLALAPRLETSHPIFVELNYVGALKELYELRDRVHMELKALPEASPKQDIGALSPYLSLAHLTHRVAQRIQTEEKAEAAYHRAIELGHQALSTRSSGRGSLSALKQEEFLWKAAIKRLATIPPESLLADQATAKRQQYEWIVEPISVKIDLAQSGFLKEIAAQTGLPQRVRISVCHISGECRNYQGDRPPASPASLIKLPIAVVLMHKVMTEGVDLDTRVYIEPANFTENADGAKIFIDHEYTLREIMARMIKESNNIATNQLIDFLGRDYINQTLRQMEYPVTFVDYKLVGDRIFPKNAGSKPNRTTTNELTEMMRRIYTFENPGDEEILDALVGQYDWDFGYMALKGLGPNVHWIGEKLGQNSKVIGTVVAVKIGDERYVITATIDRSADKFKLRRIIRGVVEHILEEGDFEGVQPSRV